MNLLAWRLLLPLTLLPWVQSALAWDTSWPTSQELALLPPYCKALLVDKAGSPEYIRWANAMGEGFGDTHHYCAGLNYIHRSYRSGSPQDKRGYYSQAVNEFSYVIDKAPRSYMLLPEILLERGTAYAGLKQTRNALSDFEASIVLKPDFSRAYLSLSDMYVNMNQIGEARKVLQRGLEQVPTSKVLSARLQELERKGH